MPSLSHLLENPRVRDTDSLVICVQIHCPVGPSIPQQPSVYYVPRDLLDGLESSLDNPSEFNPFLIQYFKLAELWPHSLDTGDVRFVCLEKYAGLDGSITLDASSSIQSTNTNLSDSISPFGSHTIARKRIIYAHSDILTRRSEYFATMLSSSFAENSAISTGERKLYTIVVEEADFETIYWLLKYCYANWLLFKQDDDPRLAVEGVGAGWSARWLSGHQGEWDWKAVNKRGPGEDEIGDSRSATSGESLPLSSAVSRSTSRKSDTYHRNPVQNNSTSAPVARTGPAKPATTSTIARPTNSTAASSRRTPTVHSTSNPQAVTMSVGDSSPALPRIKPTAVPNSSTFPSSPQYPVSPRTNRHPTSMASSSDPHPHPTPAPAPASALSIYQVAHRYIMPNLAALALEHIMSTITPQSSFALLLATSSWDELHPLVEVSFLILY